MQMPMPVQNAHGQYMGQFQQQEQGVVPIQMAGASARQIQQQYGGDVEGNQISAQMNQQHQFLKIYTEWCDRSLLNNLNYLRLILSETSSQISDVQPQNQEQSPIQANKSSSQSLDICFYVPLKGSNEENGGQLLDAAGGGAQAPNVSGDGVLKNGAKEDEQFMGLSAHSQYYLKLNNRRQEYLLDYIQQFNDECDDDEGPLKRQKLRDEIKQFKETEALFQQPQMDLYKLAKSFQTIKERVLAKLEQDKLKSKSIVTRVFSADNNNLNMYDAGQFQTQPSTFLMSPTQINSALLIQVLNHLKHGHDLLSYLVIEQNAQQILFPKQQDLYNISPYSQLNVELTSDIILYCYALKLDKLLEQILETHVMPNLNQDNVLYFMKLSILFLEVVEARLRELDGMQQYQNQEVETLQRELIVEENEFENKCQKLWSEFYKKCHLLVYENLEQILLNQLWQFLELKHFSDPLHDKLLSDSKLQDEYFGHGNHINNNQIVTNFNREQENQHFDNICERMLIKCIEENWLNQATYNFTYLLQALCKLKGLTSIFELLRAEKEKTYKHYETLQHQAFQNMKPSHEWEIKQLDKLKIEEDNPFFHDNALWKLGVTFKKENQSSLRITMNLVQDPFQNKKTKVYFKKREFFTSNMLPQHAGGSNPHNQLNSNNQEMLFGFNQDESQMTVEQQAEYAKIKEYIEAMKDMQYAPHTFISIITATKFMDEAYRMPRISTLIVQSKSPTIVQNLKCFIKEDYLQKEQETGQIFKIGIFVKVQKTLSAILSSISMNFSSYCDDPLIQTLDVDDFKQMLRHKRFGVGCEDDVLKAINNWLRNPFITDEQISQIIMDVNWNYTSLPYLINLAQLNPKLRANADFRKVFDNEIKMRLAFDPEQKIEDPRYCYKHCMNNLPFDFFQKDLTKEQREIIKQQQTRIKQLIMERNSNFENQIIEILMNPCNLMQQQHSFAPQLDPYRFDAITENMHLLSAQQMASLKKIMSEDSKNRQQMTKSFIDTLIKKESQLGAYRQKLIELDIANPTELKKIESVQQIEQSQALVQSLQIRDNPGSQQEISNHENEKVAQVIQDSKVMIEKSQVQNTWKISNNDELQKKPNMTVNSRGIIKKIRKMKLSMQDQIKRRLHHEKKLPHLKKYKFHGKKQKGAPLIETSTQTTCMKQYRTIGSQCVLLNENEIAVQQEMLTTLNHELTTAHQQIKLLEEKLKIQEEKLNVDREAKTNFQEEFDQTNQLENENQTNKQAAITAMSGLPMLKVQSSRSLDQMLRGMQEQVPHILPNDEQNIQGQLDLAMANSSQVVNSRQQRGHHRNFTVDYQNVQPKLDYQQKQPPVVQNFNQAETAACRQTQQKSSKTEQQIDSQLTQRLRDVAQMKQFWLTDKARLLSRDMFDHNFLAMLARNQKYNYRDLNQFQKELINIDEVSSSQFKAQPNQVLSFMPYEYQNNIPEAHLGDHINFYNNDVALESYYNRISQVENSSYADQAAIMSDKYSKIIHSSSPQSFANEKMMVAKPTYNTCQQTPTQRSKVIQTKQGQQVVVDLSVNTGWHQQMKKSSNQQETTFGSTHKQQQQKISSAMQSNFDYQQVHAPPGKNQQQMYLQKVKVTEEEWRTSSMSNYKEENVSDKMSRLNLNNQTQFKTSILTQHSQKSRPQQQQVHMNPERLSNIHISQSSQQYQRDLNQKYHMLNCNMDYVDPRIHSSYQSTPQHSQSSFQNVSRDMFDTQNKQK